MLPPVIQPENRAQIALRAVSGTLAHRATCLALFVGEMYLEPVGILIAHPRLGKCGIRPIAKPRHIPCEHVISGFARDDPIGGQQPHAPGLRKAGDDPVTTEIIAQLGDRTKEHITVRRPDHRPVDHTLYPGLANCGHARDGAQHVFLDPFQIIGKKLMTEPLRGAVLGPEPQVLFICPDKQTLALLAQVIFAIAVRNRRQPPVHARDLCNGFGHEILVLCRLQWQLDTGQCCDLASPQSGGVHDPPGRNITLCCAHDPRAVGLLFGACDRAKPDDLSPVLPRARRIGIGHARGVHIAARWFIHDAADAIKIHQRMQRFGLGPADLMKIQAVILGFGGLQPQLMLARLCLRQIQRSGLEHAAALPCLGLKRVIQIHRIVLDARDVVVIVQPVNVGRRMPCRPRRQFITLQQHNIRPAQLGQVVQDGAADNAASDDDGLGMGAHKGLPEVGWRYADSLTLAKAPRLPVRDTKCRTRAKRLRKGAQSKYAPIST